jgi:hypothetical protein
MKKKKGQTGRQAALDRPGCSPILLEKPGKYIS